MDRNSDFSKCTNDELLEMAQDGNSYCEEELITRYKWLVRQRAANYFVQGGDRDDLIQEGMIGVCEAVRDFRDDRGSSLESFVNLCVTRRIISAVRKSTRMKHKILNQAVSLDGDIDDKKYGAYIKNLTSRFFFDPAELVFLEEVFERLKNTEESIFSDFEKKVWQQMCMDRNNIEIAENLGKSQKSVSNAVQRIKIKIETLLRE